MKESVFAVIHGEARKFPFDDTREPDERAYVIKFDRPEAFLRVQNVKTCITEPLILNSN